MRSKPLSRNRYLTYVPTGGGLVSYQPFELEMALYLPLKSGRRLLIPPFLTDGQSKMADYVESATSDKAPKRPLHGVSQITDIGDNLSDRFGALDGASQNIPARFSELTLSEFNTCPTQWGRCIREEEYPFNTP